MHGHKESNKDLNLKILCVWTRTHDLCVSVCTNCVSGVCVSSRVSVYKFLIKFNHLYLGTGCVCFLGKGGNTPYARTQGE